MTTDFILFTNNFNFTPWNITYQILPDEKLVTLQGLHISQRWFQKLLLLNFNEKQIFSHYILMKNFKVIYAKSILVCIYLFIQRTMKE